jgi:hypothetical protein
MRSRLYTQYFAPVKNRPTVFLLLVLFFFAFSGFKNNGNDDGKYYTGRLGYYPIELYLDKNGKQLNGAYIQRYMHDQQKIELYGEIDKHGKFKLKGNGIFSGHISNGQITGYWYRSEDSREQYPFSLKEKKTDYHAEDLWESFSLQEGSVLQIPSDAQADTLACDKFMNNQMALCQELDKKTDNIQSVNEICFSIPDSSIVSKFSLEIAVYKNIDSLSTFLPHDTIGRYRIDSMVINGKTFQFFSYGEGTTDGSYNSKIYFITPSAGKYSYLFHLFYAYANPWIYGNPYSKEEYDGPYINNLNHLVEFAEHIIGSI